MYRKLLCFKAKLSAPRLIDTRGYADANHGWCNFFTTAGATTAT
jgi:hypothetical protein